VSLKLRSPVTLVTALRLLTMPITELPYAADAEMSLNYDELEVCRPRLSIAFVAYLS
jgi:hypothetical protein